MPIMEHQMVSFYPHYHFFPGVNTFVGTFFQSRIGIGSQYIPEQQSSMHGAYVEQMALHARMEYMAILSANLFERAGALGCVLLVEPILKDEDLVIVDNVQCGA